MADSDSRSISQLIYDSNVYSKAIPGRGNGLVASQNLPANSQILFVKKASMLALETPRLADTCYDCLRTDDEDSHGDAVVIESDSVLNLRSCTGCNTVKFCGKECQTAAWQAYHKHECKLYSKLHPRVLPGSVRAVIRLLKQRQAGLLSDEEWMALQDLESHQEDLSRVGGEKWQNIFLMMKAVKTYSGSKEGIETILKICCILMMNSFTLTTPTFDPLGIIFHPLPALINHSCTPNAFVRFDVSPSTTSVASCATSYGTITIQTLQPIPADTEITISYIDTTSPFALRQSELSDRYFFSCSCPLCLQLEDSITDRFADFSSEVHHSEKNFKHSSDIQQFNNIEEIEPKLIHTLRSTQSKPGTEAQHIPSIITALAILSQPLSCSVLPATRHTIQKSLKWPLHRYPSPQLRHQLILGYLSTDKYRQAMEQSLLVSHKIDPLLYKQPYHPTRLVHLWRLFKLIRLCAFDDDVNALEEEKMILSFFACSLIQELFDISSSTTSSLVKSISSTPAIIAPTTDSPTTTPHPVNRVVPTTSKFSRMIQAAYTELRTNTPLWTAYMSNQQVMAGGGITTVQKKIDDWADSVIERLLTTEKGA